MKKIFLILIPVLFSCGETKNINETSTEIKNDTVGIINASSAISFDDKLFKQLQFPLLIDTTFIQKCDTNERVTYELVRHLGSEILKHEVFNSLSYQMNTFCEIDSLKQDGTYEDYVKKLDIGMTKTSIAFRIGMLSLANNSKLFLWGIESSSYEACPFHSGKTIVATFVNENKINTHFIIGELFSAGDPPSMMNKEINSQLLLDGKIEIKCITINDDIDVPGEETTTELLKLSYSGGKIVVEDFKREIKNTEKPN